MPRKVQARPARSPQDADMSEEIPQAFDFVSMSDADVVNINGSDDPFYRYTMPAVRVKFEGSGTMKKSILENLVAISEAIGRPMEALLQHLGQSLSAASDGKSARPYVSGHHSKAELQEQVFVYIRSCVLCERCNNPETTVEVSGPKKRARVALTCRSCGAKTDLDTDLKCVKRLVQHEVKKENDTEKTDKKHTTDKKGKKPEGKQPALLTVTIDDQVPAPVASADPAEAKTKPRPKPKPKPKLGPTLAEIFNPAKPRPKPKSTNLNKMLGVEPGATPALKVSKAGKNNNLVDMHGVCVKDTPLSQAPSGVSTREPSPQPSQPAAEADVHGFPQHCSTDREVVLDAMQQTTVQQTTDSLQCVSELRMNNTEVVLAVRLDSSNSECRPSMADATDAGIPDNFAVGSGVRLLKRTRSNNQRNSCTLPVGAEGVVVEFDDEGDAKVDFGDRKRHWIEARDFGNFEVPQCLLQSFDLAGIAGFIKERGCKRIVVLCGAGISTSAGIPDFQTLYAQPRFAALPEPTSVFDIDYFRENPEPFYELAQEIWPRNQFRPTPCHYFLRLLHEKGVLLRCFTQNIDSLELTAGVPEEMVVQAHGGFGEAHVIDTDPIVTVSAEELDRALQTGTWRELRERHGGLVKPKISFYGESLFPPFFERRCDVEDCDLLIVMGSNLKVSPFNGLVGKASSTAARLLVNRDDVGLCDDLKNGFRHRRPGSNWRDVFYQGDIDAAVKELAGCLGWGDELEALINGRDDPLERAPWA